ncbi:DUF748 domain-containing protein [Kaarinaea lacus]
MVLKRGLNISGGVVVILLILAVVSYLLLPTIFKWQANSWFEAQGLDSQIEDVEINVTDGQLIIRGFSVAEAGKNLLSMGHMLVQVSLGDLLSNKLTIEKLDVGEGYLDVNRNHEGLVKVAGIVLGSEKEPSTVENDTWQVVASGVFLSKIKVCYRAEETSSSDAYFACGNLEAFEWNGAASYRHYPDSNKALSEMILDAGISIYGFALEDMLSRKTIASIDSLHIDGVKVEGRDNVNVSTIRLDRLVYQLSLQGEKAVTGKDYELSIDQLNAVALSVKNLHEVRVTTLNAGKTGLSMQADQENRLDVMRFDELKLAGVQATGINKLSFDQVDLSGYRALQIPASGEPAEQVNYIFSSKQFNASGFLIRDLSDINADRLHVAGLDMLVVYDSTESFAIQNAIKQVSPPENDRDKGAIKDNTGQKVDSRPVTVKIGELVVDDGSRVFIRDESVKPVFKTSVDNIQLTLKNIDMVDKHSKTQINLSMVVGEHGKISANGMAQIFDQHPTLNVDADVSGVNVGDFDVYANRLIRHKVKSGHLDAKLDVKIDKGKLDSNAKVTLHKFYIEESDRDEQDQYEESLGIPLSTALSLLRSRDDSININIPVTGDVEKPEFSVGDIVRKFSALAIKEAVIHYYTPFGLVKLLTAGYDLATALRFEPVTFDTGQSDIDGNDKEQLDKLETLMTERPGVHLVVCGYASRDDFTALFPGEAKAIKKQLEQRKAEKQSLGESEMSVLDEQEVAIEEKAREKLDELAVMRGKAVKQYLVDQLKIKSDRLILCNPKFSYADTGKARAEITI